MRPITVSVGPLAAASANNISLSQTPTAAFLINGANAVAGVATLDLPRRVLVTAAANESAKTITITGTDVAGQSQTEVITGPNATTGYTNLDFKTITAISISAAAAGSITVGTNGVASSAWVRFDDYAAAQSYVQAVATGTVNFTIQITGQDPNSALNPVLPYQVVWSNSPDATAVSATGSISSYFAYTPVFAKVTMNSGTGSVSSVFSQLGAVPY